MVDRGLPPEGRATFRMVKALRAGFAGIVFAGLAAGTAGSLTGCAVSDADVHRWETTERGPEKLVAVVTHDKYSWQLRTEAALSLIRMKPRAGRRIGNDLLIQALEAVADEPRRKIVAGMSPELVKNITAPRPAKNPDGTWPPDPSVPFKDATFAMLSHEPTLVTDDKAKAELLAALTQWTQTDFENRIDLTSQQYGIEQMMRYLGAPSVRGLPGIITEDSLKIDRAAMLIAELGDADTKQKGSDALVNVAKRIESPEWVSKNTALVEEANRRAKANVNADQLKGQVTKFQDGEMTKVFGAMKKLGGRPVVDFCLAYAENKAKPEERRKASLAAVEGRIDKTNSGDIDKTFRVATAEDTPDGIRDLAYARLGELPKELIVPKLYPLFESPKWKLRWVSASLILKTLSTKQVPEFMRHLPTTAAVKMGMTEPITYGSQIQRIEPAAGDPKQRESIMPFLNAKEVGPKLTAIGFFYGGRKADQGVLKPLEEDKTPVSKCEEADECGWKCPVAKAGNPKEMEDKAITTVGEFVKHCVIPSMEGN